MSLNLSERQRSTVSVAITLVAAAVIVLAVLGLFWLAGHFPGPLFERVHAGRGGGGGGAGIQALLRMAAPQAEEASRWRWWWSSSRCCCRSPVSSCSSARCSATRSAGWSRKGPELREKFDSQVAAHLPAGAEIPRGGSLGPEAQGRRSRRTPKASSKAPATWARRLFSAGAGLVGWVFGLLGWFVAPIYFAFFLTMEYGKGPGSATTTCPSSRRRPARTWSTCCTSSSASWSPSSAASW